MSDHAKVIEPFTLADESEPVAEDTGVHQKDGLALTAGRELDLDIVHWNTLPAVRSVVHVRALALDGARVA